MYTGIKHFHSYLAYLALIILLLAGIFALYSWIAKKPYTKANKTLNLLGMVFTHTQLLIGLILYFVSPMGLSNFSGEAMKNSFSRLYILEHPLMMIIAAVLVSIGYIKAKKQSDEVKNHKTIAIFYILGLLIILSRIPWEAWLKY